jgi:hypothetical protein
MGETIEIQIPEAMVIKYVKDFELLPGGGHRDSVLELRKSIMTVLFTLWEAPELMDEPKYHDDLVKALAVRQAMCELGIFYDA